MKAVCGAVLLAIALSGCTASHKNDIRASKSVSGVSASMSSAASGTTTTSSSAAPAVLPAAQAAAIKSALDNGSPSRVKAVLDPAVRAAYVKSPKRLLPRGSIITIDPSSMKVSGDHAQVRATVTSSGKTTAWTLLLKKTGGKWLIYGTRK